MLQTWLLLLLLLLLIIIVIKVTIISDSDIHHDETNNSSIVIVRLLVIVRVFSITVFFIISASVSTSSYLIAPSAHDHLLLTCKYGSLRNMSRLSDLLPLASPKTRGISFACCRGEQQVEEMVRVDGAHRHEEEFHVAMSELAGKTTISGMGCRSSFCLHLARCEELWASR